MANNEEISQEVKVEETQQVSVENETKTNEAKVEQKAEKTVKSKG